MFQFTECSFGRQTFVANKKFQRCVTKLSNICVYKIVWRRGPSEVNSVVGLCPLLFTARVLYRVAYRVLEYSTDLYRK